MDQNLKTEEEEKHAYEAALKTYETALKVSEEAHKEYKKDLRQRFDAERKMLNDASLAVAGFYDKGIIYTTGGAVAISLVFLEKIAPIHDGCPVGVLVASWTLLGTGLLCHLFSLTLSQQAVRRQIDILSADYNRFSTAPLGSTPRNATRTNKDSKWTGRFSQAAIYSVIFGVACLALFFVISIIEKKNSTYGQKTATSASTPTSTANGLIHSSGIQPATASAVASAPSGEKTALQINSNEKEFSHVPNQPSATPFPTVAPALAPKLKRELHSTDISNAPTATSASTTAAPAPVAQSLTVPPK